jgi:ribosome-associated protein
MAGISWPASQASSGKLATKMRMQRPPASRFRRWGCNSGHSLRKPAGEGASIGAPYVRPGLRRPAFLKLDQFLKWQGLAASGGEAKRRIQRGDVRVNDGTETRRGRQLFPGDVVAIDGREVLVTATD